MDKQKNLFIGIIGFLLLSCAGWYFMYFSELNNSLESISDSYNQLKSEKSKYTQIKNKFPSIRFSLFYPNELATGTILRTINNQDLSKQLGKEGRKFVMETFNWEKIARNFVNVLNSYTQK